MNKLTLCRLATISCGLLAIVVYTCPDTSTSQFYHWNGAALGVISAIFGTQWVEYQKRRDVASVQSRWANWLRRLLFSSLLGLITMTSSGQTNWTALSQSSLILSIKRLITN